MLKTLCLLLLILQTLSYIELELTRLPKDPLKLPFSKNQCQDPTTINDQTKYQQLCLEKDIAYTIELEKHPNTYRLALDLTTPVSWLKGQTCKIITTEQKCTLIELNLAQRINSALKHKITELIKKLKMKIADEETDKVVIEGSNEVVMGSEQKITNITLVAKNTDHVSHFLDAIMLGLFIIGEKDVISLNETTFIRAHQISPNLDSLCDGAVSLRFDENSENSFLNELFKYSNSKDKIISIYLGDRVRLATIGSYSPKFMKNGLSSLKRIKIQQDAQQGKLPQIQALIVQGKNLGEINMEDNSSAVFSLSSSFLAFPNHTINNFIKQVVDKPNNCKASPFLQCTFKDKDDLQSFLESTLNIDFDTSIVGFNLKDLLLHRQGKKIKLNIKQSLNNYTILGEPFFLKYYAYFDFQKNQIGFAERALSIEESFIATVTLIHLVMLIILFALCFVLSSQKCRTLYYQLFLLLIKKAQPSLNRIRQAYKPVRGGQANEQMKQTKPSLAQDVEGI